MRPNILDGDAVVLAPADTRQLRRGDLAFSQTSDGLRLHRVAALHLALGQFTTRGDAGLEHDPPSSQLIGKAIAFSRGTRQRSLSLWRTRLLHPLATQLHRLIRAANRRFSHLFGIFFLLLFLSAFVSFSAPSAFAQADLALTQVPAPTVIAPGNNITYTESVTNNGPNAATTAVIYQQTPPNTTFVSITAPAGWTCANPAVGGTGQVTCTRTGGGGTLANGAVANFTFQVQVTLGTAAGTTIVNSANVTSQTADNSPQNNATTTTVLVESAANSDVALTMSASPSPVFVFSALTYTIQVRDLGLANATNVIVTDTIPAGTTFVSSTPSQGSCSGSPTITCNLGTINNAASATISILVTSPSSASTLSNTATVATTPADTVAGNNSSTVVTVAQPLACATPGRDGLGNNITGIVNIYYPPSGATTLAAGSNSVSLGASLGAAVPIAIGDLLLIIQMQDATINSTNTGSYGDGSPGDPATGWLALNSSGRYEFVTATSAVPVGGGALTFLGTGASGGALNTYTSAAFGANGQKSFQVIRVPQYTNVTLGAALSALSWNGSVGGVLVLDSSSQLNLNSSTVNLSGLGFRGGAGRQLAGAAGHAATDYITLASVATNASKGEGIAGTPRFVANSTDTVVTDTAVEGYPNGSYARGAPANAGAGATDANPTANDQNSGGGGGGNGGIGGYGGYGWNTAGIVGGHYGSQFPSSTSFMVMGGGGGAGTTNNGTADPANANPAGINSSGSSGGAILIVRAGSFIGTGTFTSNGLAALNVANDGGGGGGAGGSILAFANSGTLAGLTVNAVGGTGGNTWGTSAPGAFPGNRHGPGGGGGGGVVLLSSPPAASSVLGGINGNSTTAKDAYGATPGQSGTLNSTYTITQTPGTQSGAYCSSTDLSVTNSGSPPVVAPGNNITYTQVVTNNGSFDAVNAVFSETVPANTTFQSIAAPGWICVTPPVNGTGNISCTNADFAAGASTTITVVVKTGAATPNGTQIVDVANITSGTSDPNLANNTAIAITTVGAVGNADLVLTNTTSAPTVNAGSNVTMTAVVSNQGPSAASSLTFFEDIPPNTTLGALFVPPAGWVCNSIPVGGTGTLGCSTANLAAGGTSTFPLVLNVTAGTAAGTVISATATVSSATPDPNSTNNTATATTVVASAGQVDLAITASGSPNPVTQGNNISYVETVTNNGPAPEVNATFKVTIPANTTFVSLTTPPNWTCGPVIPPGGTGTINCILNIVQTIAVGASVNFPLVVNVNPTTAPGTVITLSPTISSTVGDPNAANNSATVTTVVASPTQADVSILKTASPEPVNQGTILAYTIQVTNHGPAIAQGVVVTDVLPAQVSYSSSFTPQGSCSYTALTTTVSCNLGSIGVGSLVVLTINVTANTFSSASLSSNTATVSATTGDPNAANNSSTAISTIQAPTAVDLSSLRAFTQPDGSVSLEWRTHEESRNLGFHVFREDAAGRHLVNPSLIAGSALLLRGSRPQHAAKSYRWIDPQPVPNAAYWIEDVDINGTRTLHGPVFSETPSAERSAALAATPASPLLSRLQSSSLASTSISPVLNVPRPFLPSLPPGLARQNVSDLNAIKISVDHEGWYRVSFSQLFAAGLDSNTDPRSLHLFAEGVEQPLLLRANSSGPASPPDVLEFYGTGIDTPFSATRVYWLVREGHSGKRILTLPAASSGSVAPSGFSFAVVHEDRTTYFPALLNGENNDNFFGAVVTTDPVDQDLLLAHLDPSSALPISLDLTLQGGTDAQQHSVTVQFNGANIGEMDFFGQILAKQSFPVEASLLHDGANTVTLTSLNGENDVSLVQTIALHYPHTFVADSNWLRATAPAGSQLQLSGFSNPQIRVFDISDPLNISELSGNVALQSGSYTFSLSLSTTAPSQRTLLAFTDDTVALPISLAHHLPTFLDDRHVGADIVIVSHPDFVASLAPLVRLRESQGLHVALVTTEQIYDDYNFGERSPFALRNFLFDAVSHWHRKPQSLLLVGDASFDPRNYLGLGEFDFVPSRLIETAAFKTASDDWFSDFLKNGFATLPTGRLPVRAPADADLVVSKIVGYEQGSFAGSWNSQALLIADQNVDANFTAAANSAAGSLPSSLQLSRIFADGQDAATVRSQILDALNTGALFVNYNGHGAEQQWSFANLFNNDDAAALTNGGRLPVYLLMDCLNGFFHDVYGESLAESLLLAPNGGAVAVWASSGFTDQSPQSTMNQALLSQFASHPGDPLGRLILRAKAGTLDSDVRRTWILFGDPAMKFALTPSAAPRPAHSDSSPNPAPSTDIPRACPRTSVCIKEKPQQ
jgi:uncharacterized repeat protein (TIGR01451 family)